MKIVTMLLVATFFMAAGTSFAFGECAAHKKAQLVKAQPQEQLSTDQTAATPFTVAEKVTEPEKPAAKTSEKK